jgi:hypothetical protein
MKIRKIVSGFVVVFVTASADAQGFVDFSEIPGLDAEPMLEVNVTPLAIAVVRGGIQAGLNASANPDPQMVELLDLLNKLRGIQLRTYRASDNSRQINRFIDDISEELEDERWERVMSVQDEGSKVRVLMRMSEEEVSGVTVMAIDGDEAFFINVDATISVEDLGKILAHFNMSQFLAPMGGMPFPLPPAAPGVPAE